MTKNVDPVDFSEMIARIINKENLDLEFKNEKDHKPFDTYIDEQIVDNSITKMEDCNFLGTKYAEKINDRLTSLGSLYRLVPVLASDPLCDVKVKGQGVYFIITKDNINHEQLVLTFCYNPINIFPLKKQ